MTTQQRERLFDVLMEGIPLDIGEQAYEAMASMVSHEIDLMEPVINDITAAAFRAGAMFADRKTELQIVRRA